MKEVFAGSTLYKKVFKSTGTIDVADKVVKSDAFLQQIHTETIKEFVQLKKNGIIYEIQWKI